MSSRLQALAQLANRLTASIIPSDATPGKNHLTPGDLRDYYREVGNYTYNHHLLGVGSNTRTAIHQPYAARIWRQSDGFSGGPRRRPTQVAFEYGIPEAINAQAVLFRNEAWARLSAEAPEGAHLVEIDLRNTMTAAERIDLVTGALLVSVAETPGQAVSLAPLNGLPSGMTDLDFLRLCAKAYARVTVQTPLERLPSRLHFEGLSNEWNLLPYTFQAYRQEYLAQAAWNPSRHIAQGRIINHEEAQQMMGRLGGIPNLDIPRGKPGDSYNLFEILEVIDGLQQARRPHSPYRNSRGWVGQSAGVSVEETVNRLLTIPDEQASLFRHQPDDLIQILRDNLKIELTKLKEEITSETPLTNSELRNRLNDLAKISPLFEKSDGLHVAASLTHPDNLRYRLRAYNQNPRNNIQITKAELDDPHQLARRLLTIMDRPQSSLILRFNFEVEDSVKAGRMLGIAMREVRRHLEESDRLSRFPDDIYLPIDHSTPGFTPAINIVSFMRASAGIETPHPIPPSNSSSVTAQLLRDYTYGGT